LRALRLLDLHLLKLLLACELTQCGDLALHVYRVIKLELATRHRD
jgi:hypothetical protein